MTPQDSNRLESQPGPDQSPVEYQNEETIPAKDNRPPPLEDILELEEDWEEGQFADADLIDHHNTTQESDRIRWEYSVHFSKTITGRTLIPMAYHPTV